MTKVPRPSRLKKLWERISSFAGKLTPPRITTSLASPLKKILIFSGIIVLLINLLLGWQIFHFNCRSMGLGLASLFVYFVLSIVFFPIVLWCFSLFYPRLFEAEVKENKPPKLFSEKSGFFHMTKAFLLPIAGGFIALAITEKVKPTRVEVKLAITDFEPEPRSNVTDMYENEYIQPAVQNLGNFADVISIKVEKIGKPYDNILDALQNERIDLAVVSPFTYIFYKKMGDSVFNNSLKVIGFKFPNTGGHHYYSGFVFNKDNGNRIREMLQQVDTLVSRAARYPGNTSNFRLILSDESLSTSGRIVPERWLIERDLACLVKDANFLPAKEMLPIIAYNEGYFGALSTNQWEIFQKADPELSARLEFYPLEEVPIPFDPLMVKNEVWDKKFTKWYHLIADFFLLRNLDLCKTRQDIILESLRGIVKRVDKEGESLNWDSCNAAFVDYLFTGIVKDSSTIIFPAPYSQLGYQLKTDLVHNPIYDIVFLNTPNIIMTQFLTLPVEAANRNNDWYSFVYPLELGNFNVNPVDTIIPNFTTWRIGYSESNFTSINPYLRKGRLVRVPHSLIRLDYVPRTNLPGRLFKPLSTSVKVRKVELE